MKAASTDFNVKAQCNGSSYLRSGFVVAVLGLLAMFPSCSFARPALSLTVRVFNYAHVSPQTFSSAARNANHILAAAGLQVAWLDCLQEAQTVQSKTLCEMGWSPELPALRLMSGQVTKQFQDLEFGFATVPVLVTVSYEHIANRALRDNSPSEESTLLGCVIAHELGHLFLGSDSHSSVGIMQPHWGRDQFHQAETSNLRFTTEQAVQLRKRVQHLADRQQEIGSLQAETSAQSRVLSTGHTHEKGDTDDPPLAVHGTELPFRFSEGYLIMIEGQIGTETNLKFILDTGATVSIVDSRIADKLNLPRYPAESLSFDRKLTWQATTVPEVQFGQIKAKNIQMLVGHLGEYSEFAKKADVIIGMDLLKLINFSIDYDSKKIIFHSHQRERIPTSGEPLSECLTLELQVQGHPVRLIVDTGFPGLLLYEERLLKHVPALRMVGSPNRVSIGGRLQAKQAVLPDVVLGARNGEASVLLMKAPPPDILPGIDGVVGLAPLRARRVHFDFVERRLSWE
jgi:predicted aspartyl protease